jgi:hypothetical protein
MADLIQPQRVATFVGFPGGSPVDMVIGTGTRVVATAGSTSTTAAAVPAGGAVLIIRATEPAWIRFGDSGVGAAAADANSILLFAGEARYVLKSGETHFRVLRAGGTDALIQLESVATL